MYSRTSGLADYYGVSKRTENREGTIIFDGYKEDGTKNDIGITGANAQQEYYSILNNIDESMQSGMKKLTAFLFYLFSFCVRIKI